MLHLYVHMCVPHLYVHLPVGGFLGYFHLLVIVSTAMNTYLMNIYGLI